MNITTTSKSTCIQPPSPKLILILFNFGHHSSGASGQRLEPPTGVGGSLVCASSSSCRAQIKCSKRRGPTSQASKREPLMEMNEYHCEVANENRAAHVGMHMEAIIITASQN